MRWALPILFAAFTAMPAQAAKLTAADRAWIESCVKQRDATREKRAALRRYCVCMQGIVEDNRPFEITELERAYSPAHLMCRKKSGRR